MGTPKELDRAAENGINSIFAAGAHMLERKEMQND